MQRLICPIHSTRKLAAPHCHWCDEAKIAVMTGLAPRLIAVFSQLQSPAVRERLFIWLPMKRLSLAINESVASVGCERVLLSDESRRGGTCCGLRTRDLSDPG